MSINVGVIGMGMMGGTHLDVYQQLDGVRVVAVADRNADKRSGQTQAAGNIEGQAQGGFDFDSVKQYATAAELIADPEVALIDVCVPTAGHLETGLKALASGKHVLIEKPLARTADQAAELVAAAERSDGLAICGMCMRFWPGWTWLKQVVDDQRFGRVLGATFRRLSEHPGGKAYLDGDACGGGILDLHLHDTDFIHHCFGLPQAVTTTGYTKETNQPDHVVTQYHYDNIPLVVAEGGWSMAKGFGFQMHYAVNFERATAVFNLAEESPLTLYEPGEDPRKIELDPGMGYLHEIAYFLDCIRENRAPQRVTLAQAAASVRLIEAEARSMQTGSRVAFDSAT